MPNAHTIGITSVRPPMAIAKRRSPAASRRSRKPTSAVLCRFSLIIQFAPDDRQVDLLQRRQLPHLLAQLQARAAAQVTKVAVGEELAAGHDPDAPRERFRLLHRMGADD